MPDPLTPDEAKALIEATGRHGFIAARDRAFLSLLYRCGLRNNEARMLDMHDIRDDRDPWTVRVRYPKGWENGKPPRELGIDQGTKAHLREWLAWRGTKVGPLFVTTKGGRIHTSHYRRRIKWLGERAGIRRRVHPHVLRHTFARTLMDEGVPIRLIQEALGHSSLATTEKYLQGIGAPEVVAMTSERDW